MFWRKKKADNAQESKIIIGMVMLHDTMGFDVNRFNDDFVSQYGRHITQGTGGSSSLVFTVEGEMVVIGHVEAPIPSGDIEGTAQYAYNWQTALEDLKGHKSHLIVSLMRGSQDAIKRFKIFTQVISSLLRTTNAIGVYKGNQSLLIPKQDYLIESEMMGENVLPLNLWIYFGLRVTDSGNSSYTYGLKEFGKTEMEIINSRHDLEEVRGFLFNIAYYVIEHNVSFQNGQTVGGSEDEKIKITLSKGEFVAGETFKLGY